MDISEKRKNAKKKREMKKREEKRDKYPVVQTVIALHVEVSLLCVQRSKEAHVFCYSACGGVPHSGVLAVADIGWRR